ncbi:unnamed protein product [Discosporangium mesarthrocarpum]
MEGNFDVWWVNITDPVSEIERIKGLKVDELREELSSRGMDSKGTKTELKDRMVDAINKYNLGDDNFSQAEVVDSTYSDEDLPDCFPQVIVLHKPLLVFSVARKDVKSRVAPVWCRPKHVIAGRPTWMVCI